jgi:hypothetical protein
MAARSLVRSIAALAFVVIAGVLPCSAQFTVSCKTRRVRP